jgi:hypothetical protein
VPPGLARNFGEPPFGLFVMELPLSAACAPVTVTGHGPDATERVPPRPKLCARARRSRRPARARCRPTRRCGAATARARA